MQNILTFPKIGNLKLGIVRNGKPIQTSRILVTLPTKEGTENFKIYPGFNEDGEDFVKCSLLFDDNKLNFEINYVGFLTIDKVDYIAKAEDIGSILYFYPLNVENFDKKIINAGELTQEKIDLYCLEKTGFLKVMVNDVSGFGEMFYFKTKSINTMKTISDQLNTLSILTNGKIAGMPLVLKPVKKDSGENQVIFLSIAFDGAIYSNQNRASMDRYLSFRDKSKILFDNLEIVYNESRIVDEESQIPLADVDESLIKMNKDVEKEIEILIRNEENKELSETELYVQELITELQIDLPLGLVVAVLGAFDGDKDSLLEFLKSEPTPSQCIAKINKKA